VKKKKAKEEVKIGIFEASPGSIPPVKGEKRGNAGGGLGSSSTQGGGGK